MARKIKHRKLKLTDKREKWAQGRDTTLRSKPLRLNEAYQERQVKEVQSELDKLNKDVMRQVMALFNSRLAKETFAQDASLASQAAMLMNKISREWGKRFNLFADHWADSMGDGINKEAGRDLGASMEALTGGMTIKTTSMSPATKDILKAGTTQAASLIKSVPEDYLSYVQESMMRSITMPESSFAQTRDKLHSVLSDKFKRQRNKAKNLVLDQTKKTYESLNTQRMEEIGVEEYIWRHGGGSQNPRSYHKNVLNGQKFRIDDPPIIDQKTGERGMPGDAINCFPGESKVGYFFGVNRAYRHFYSGKSTEIVTDNGSVLKSTPNHPILTQRGWVAADLIECGDYVIDISSDSLGPLRANTKEVETSISDVFSAILLLGTVESSAVRGGELHGDVTDQEVDIVSSQWVLGGDIKASGFEEVDEILLAMAEMVVSETPAYSSLFKFILGSTHAPHRIVSGLSNFLSVGFGCVGHPDFCGNSPASDIEALLLEKLGNVASGYSEFLRHFKDGYLGGVELMKLVAWDLISWLRNWSSLGYFNASTPKLNAEVVGVATKLGRYVLEHHASGDKGGRVVEKRAGKLFAHVYNLEMDNGLYITQNIVVSNCRCYKEPVISFGDK